MRLHVHGGSQLRSRGLVLTGGCGWGRGTGLGGGGVGGGTGAALETPICSPGARGVLEIPV